MNLKDAKSTFLLEHCAERCDGYQKDDTCENCEINAAIEALDKQMPKKPKLKGEYYVCPVCGVYQETSEGNPPYCINCGQAIDWGCRGMTELKECPFCGCKAEIKWEKWTDISPECGVYRLKAEHFAECFFVRMNGTNVKSEMISDNKESLIAAWNRRAE